MSGSLGFSVRVSLPELDRERYLKDFKDHLNKALIAAARKFLLAAVPRVPIFTGFARGAFGNLEDLAGRVSSGKIDSRKGGYTKAKSFQKKKYYYYAKKGAKGVLRNTVNGRAYATPTEQIFSQGRATIAKTESAIFFRFSIDIKYMNYLDREKWGAFKAGQAAFADEIKAQITKLPAIGKYLIRKEVK
jgi:hypothetical protein